MNCNSSRSATNVSCLRSSRRKMLLSLSTTPRAESGSKRISAVTVFSVLNKKCGLIWLERASMRAFSSNCWCLSRFISMRVLFQIFSGAATDISVAITTRVSHQSQRASSAKSHFGLVASTSATRPSSRPTHAASGAISQDNCAFPSSRIVAFGMFRNVNGPKFQRSSLLGIACRINPPSSPANQSKCHADDQRRRHEQHQLQFLVGIALLGEEHPPERVPSRQQRSNGGGHSHLKQQGE